MAVGPKGWPVRTGWLSTRYLSSGIIELTSNHGRWHQDDHHEDEAQKLICEAGGRRRCERTDDEGGRANERRRMLANTRGGSMLLRLRGNCASGMIVITKIAIETETCDTGGRGGGGPRPDPPTPNTYRSILNAPSDTNRLYERSQVTSRCGDGRMCKMCGQRWWREMESR